MVPPRGMSSSKPWSAAINRSAAVVEQCLTAGSAAPVEAGMCFPTGLMLLGVGWTRTDQVKRSGVDASFSGLHRARETDDVASGHALPACSSIWPGERRHVDLPAAPVGRGSLLSNQLHTSSDQTILAISQSSGDFAIGKSRPVARKSRRYRRAGEQVKGTGRRRGQEAQMLYRDEGLR